MYLSYICVEQIHISMGYISKSRIAPTQVIYMVSYVVDGAKQFSNLHSPQQQMRLHCSKPSPAFGGCVVSIYTPRMTNGKRVSFHVIISCLKILFSKMPLRSSFHFQRGCLFLFDLYILDVSPFSFMSTAIKQILFLT